MGRMSCSGSCRLQRWPNGRGNRAQVAQEACQGSAKLNVTRDEGSSGGIYTRRRESVVVVE